MENRKNFYLNIALASLMVHLFATNSRLIYHLNPDSDKAGSIFDFTKLSFDGAISMVFALSYSIMTVMVIKLIKLPFGKMWTFLLIAYFALLDGIGVYVYYNAFSNYVTIASVYYAIYTLSIVCSIGLHAVYGEEVKEEEMEEDEVGAITRKINARKAVLRRKKISYDSDDELKKLIEVRDNYIQYVCNSSDTKQAAG